MEGSEKDGAGVNALGDLLLTTPNKGHVFIAFQ